jgi:hypothetical protein
MFKECGLIKQHGPRQVAMRDAILSKMRPA